MTITLDEAIKELSSYRGNYTKTDPDFGAAILLAIEAMGQIRKERVAKVGFYRDLLPGETRD